MTTRWHIEQGDALEVLKTLDSASFDACLSDPPYGLGSREPTVEDIIAYLTGARSLDTGGDFMGKAWELPPVEVWHQLHRVLKPGAFSSIFSGSRTFDLVAVGLRAARFESRDSLCWLYSSGYPHGLNVSKAIDEEAGAERPVIGTQVLTGNAAVSTKEKGGTYGVGVGTAPAKTINVTGPATEDAARYDGYGTGLKPAWEPILLMRKPLDGTVVDNVLAHGTGALNIGACRLDFADEADEAESKGKNQHADHDNGARENVVFGDMGRPRTNYTAKGRWPPNVCLSHASGCTPRGDHDDDGMNCSVDCPVRMLDEQSGITTSGAMKRDVSAYDGQSATSMLRGRSGPSNQHGDTGGASRFFYCSKASRAERELGCEALPVVARPTGDQDDPVDDDDDADIHNPHPTVKPIALTQWLSTLLLPPPHRDGSPRRLLVIYSGSGSELIGAMRAGWDEIVGVQRVANDEERAYVQIAEARLRRWAEIPAHLDVKPILRAARAAASKTKRDQLGLF